MGRCRCDRCPDWDATLAVPAGRNHSAATWMARHGAGHTHANGWPDAICTATGCGGPFDCTGIVSTNPADKCCKIVNGLCAIDTPLILCGKCVKVDCCKGDNGRGVAFVCAASTFADALDVLFVDEAMKLALERAMGTLGRRRIPLVATHQALYTLLYRRVAAAAADPASAAIIDELVPPQLCPRILQHLRDLESVSLLRILFVTSKCAAGDLVALKPGSAHFLLLSALAQGGAGVYDMTLRVGPCRRTTGASHGGCRHLSPAELWVGKLAVAVMLSALKRVADVHAVTCCAEGAGAELGVYMPHYRYTLSTVGATWTVVGPLYQLARSRMLMEWVQQADGHADTSYASVVERLVPVLRERYASVAEYTEAQSTDAWEQCKDQKYWRPMSLDESYDVQVVRQLQSSEARNKKRLKTVDGDARRALTQKSAQFSLLF